MLPILRPLLIVLCLVSAAQGGAPALLELTTKDGEQLTGRLEEMNDTYCLFTMPDGSMRRLAVRDIASSRKVGDNFDALSATELRDRLQKYYGSRYEAVSAATYVIVAPRGQAQDYAKIFDSVARSFDHYFRSRNFPITKPEFPLIGIVFADRTSFSDYAKADGMTPFPGLRGYYSQTTNRIVLFDAEAEAVSKWEERRMRADAGEASGAADPLRHASVSGDVIDTLIHEATHQMAFNTGVHPRLGQTPKWVVEGLATVFEAEGIRTTRVKPTLQQKVNLSRLRWFDSYSGSRRKSDSLATFVANDELFRSQVLDAYAEAWAVTFFLIETRPAAYFKLLKAISARDRLRTYSAKQRLEDVRETLGKDVSWLEVQFLRYCDSLADAM